MLHNRDGFYYGKIPFRYLQDGTLSPYRYHDPVLYKARLRNRSDDITFLNGIARLHGRGEVPFLFSVKGICSNTAHKKIADLVHHGDKRPLDAVIDIPDKAGSQFHHENMACSRHRFADLQSDRILVHLYDRLVPLKTDDLPREFFIAHIDDLVYLSSPHTFGDYDGPRNFPDFPHRSCLTLVVCLIYNEFERFHRQKFTLNPISFLVYVL